jgi:hypothetical protein
MAARGIEGREEEEEEEKMCNFPKMAVSDTMQEEGGGRVASEGSRRKKKTGNSCPSIPENQVAHRQGYQIRL